MAGLDLIPGKGADAEATNAIRVWATIEDDDEVVKAMREDAAEEMAAALAGTLSLSDSEEEAKGEEEEKEEVATRARNAGGTPHRPTLNYRLTSGSWRVQRRKWQRRRRTLPVESQDGDDLSACR